MPVTDRRNVGSLAYGGLVLSECPREPFKVVLLARRQICVHGYSNGDLSYQTYYVHNSVTNCDGGRIHTCTAAAAALNLVMKSPRVPNCASMAESSSPDGGSKLCTHSQVMSSIVGGVLRLAAM